MTVRPRYVPQRPLPPYSYVPGLFPHPISDADGHMHGADDLPDAETDDVVIGFDLFNHGYYWEAHEAWEQGWVAAGRQGAFADVLKGLIKLAAAGVKAREGKPEGVGRHARRARELLLAGASSDTAELPTEWKAACGTWAAFADQVAAAAENLVDTSPAPVVIVFPFLLEFPSE